MDQEELHCHRAAEQKGLSLYRNSDGTWDVMSEPALEVPKPGEPLDTILSGNRIRLADGREFPRGMTLAELKRLLEIDGDEQSETPA